MFIRCNLYVAAVSAFGMVLLIYNSNRSGFNLCFWVSYSWLMFLFVMLQTLPIIQWGRRTRVVLDVGCGVASFGGYLLDKNVITMSFAPKDEHEAQIQFALERGIPATLSVIGTKKLPYPNNAFDLIHCARCRVHWDADGISFFCFIALLFKSEELVLYELSNCFSLTWLWKLCNSLKTFFFFDNFRWKTTDGAQQDTSAWRFLYMVCYTSLPWRCKRSQLLEMWADNFSLSL